MRVARRLAAAREAGDADVPANVEPLMRIWFLLGWPAFLAVIAILTLMVAKPV